jgi:hypothetical protein
MPNQPEHPPQPLPQERQPERNDVPADAHLEEAYDERYELDDAS